MEKADILDRIKGSFNKEKDNKASNSMGVSEKFYNPYYLIGRCFEDFTELEKMTETELNNLVRLADFASEAFY